MNIWGQPQSSGIFIYSRPTGANKKSLFFFLTNMCERDTLYTSTTNIGVYMKVGDLIQYKAFPENGRGVILEIDDDMVLFYFMDDCPDYVWDHKVQLEVVTCK